MTAVSSIKPQRHVGYDRYPGWESWWLVAQFKNAHPHDTPTPGHLQSMAAIVDGLGSPWNVLSNWDRCKWYHSVRGAISFAYSGNLATYDSDRLTSLVLAAHKHHVRVEIEACNMQNMRMIFWPRDAEGGDFYARHPSLAELSDRATVERIKTDIKTEAA